jgi:hypothetical protein
MNKYSSEGEVVMPFDKKGLLGEEVNEIIKENYEQNKDVFKLSEEINMYAQEIVDLLNINSNDTQGIVAGTLFIKILNTFQSVVILYKIGLDSQCKILTRAVLENLFVLKCIVKDKKYLKLLMNSNDKKREQLLNTIKRNPYGVFDSLINEIDISELDDLSRKNHRNKINSISTKQWAEMAESYFEYYYAYKHLCNDVHVDLRNMEQYIKVDKDGNIEEFIMLPDIKDIKIILGYTANDAMIEAIMCVGNYSNIECESRIKYFKTKIMELYEYDNL